MVNDIQIILGADVGWGPTATHVGSFFAEHLELEAFACLGMTPAQAITAGTKLPPKPGLNDISSRETEPRTLSCSMRPARRHPNMPDIQGVCGAECDRARARSGRNNWRKEDCTKMPV
jgi:hypothetical protein